MITRGKECCTNANVDCIAKGLGMNKTSMLAQMKGDKGHKWSIRPEGGESDRIREDS